MPEIQAIPAFLTDKARRDAPDTDTYVPPEKVDVSDEVAKALGEVAGQPPKPAPAPVATEELTQQADVPYFSATESLGRDLTTKVGESQQRLDELAHDIEQSKDHRNFVESVIKANADRQIEAIQAGVKDAINALDSSHLQEVAILRGRETDEIKRMTALKATLQVLQKQR